VPKMLPGDKTPGVRSEMLKKSVDAFQGSLSLSYTNPLKVSDLLQWKPKASKNLQRTEIGQHHRVHVSDPGVSGVKATGS
jgi:hypothetical protein